MKFTVPFITETTELYEFDARSATEATMMATLARAEGVPPTHTSVTKFRLGSVRSTIVEPNPASDA